MVDPPTYRAQPDPAFADRLERELLKRLTAPAGSRTPRGVAQGDEPSPLDTDADDPDSDVITLEHEDRRSGQDPMTPRRPWPGRWLLVAAVAALVALVGTLLVAARDDDEQVPAGPPPVPVAADVAAFCEAIDDVGSEVSEGSGYEGVDDALVAAEEIAPAEVRAEVAVMAEESRSQVAAGAPPDGVAPDLPPDEYFVAASAVGDYMADHCGYQVIDVTATEYAFEGIPAEAARGKTLIRLTNDGAEFHRLVLQVVRYGETRSLEEIVALPEGGGELLDYQSNAFAPPGQDSWMVADLSVGRHAFMCIEPTGATSPAAVQSAIEANAPAHYAHGEIAEMQIP